MAAITFRAAWRKNDKTVEEDAKTFWRSQRYFNLPAGTDPDQRAKELCAVAYRDEVPVGVATATIEFEPQFRSNMAVYRCAVAKKLVTLPPLSWRITDYSRKLLEQWSLDNPGEKLMGLMAIMTAQSFVQNYPRIAAPANMMFTGFTPGGYPIRVAWFKHATIPTEWPPRPLAKPQPAKELTRG